VRIGYLTRVAHIPHGASGYERVETHKAGVEASGVSHSFRQELGGAWTLRFGPLSAAEVSIALTAFVR
jgi:hypothetical protein